MSLFLTSIVDSSPFIFIKGAPVNIVPGWFLFLMFSPLLSSENDNVPRNSRNCTRLTRPQPQDQPDSRDESSSVSMRFYFKDCDFPAGSQFDRWWIYSWLWWLYSRLYSWLYWWLCLMVVFMVVMLVMTVVLMVLLMVVLSPFLPQAPFRVRTNICSMFVCQYA